MAQLAATKGVDGECLGEKGFHVSLISVFALLRGSGPWAGGRERSLFVSEDDRLASVPEAEFCEYRRDVGLP